jgi:hypothetical protein
MLILQMKKYNYTARVHLHRPVVPHLFLSLGGGAGGGVAVYRDGVAVWEHGVIFEVSFGTCLSC